MIITLQYDLDKHDDFQEYQMLLSAGENATRLETIKTLLLDGDLSLDKLKEILNIQKDTEND